ncbi:MAG: orotidine-5'-phosphate decarboxylase [Pseudomonadota bacterium]
MPVHTLEDARDRLIVALDVDGRASAEHLVERIGEDAIFYKIGYQMVFGGDGLALARDLKAQGKKVFLDVKLHDIPNTIAHGVEAIGAMGLDMVTVHAYPQTMRAAVEAATGSSLTILGVSVLTSMDDNDLKTAGYATTAADTVIARAKDAAAAGMGGLVASAQEAGAIRQAIGPDMALVTPGIRPTGSATGDQKRVTTPADAISAGASHLVVGRPISASEDPKNAAKAIVAEIFQASDSQ